MQASRQSIDQMDAYLLAARQERAKAFAQFLNWLRRPRLAEVGPFMPRAAAGSTPAQNDNRDAPRGRCA